MSPVVIVDLGQADVDGQAIGSEHLNPILPLSSKHLLGEPDLDPVRRISHNRIWPRLRTREAGMRQRFREWEKSQADNE
jgi:hypothetical protein